MENMKSKLSPRLVLWTWCTILQCFISLPYISGCLDTFSTLKMYPTSSDVEYGKSLEIYCTDKRAKDLEFSIGVKVLSSDLVNTTTRRLFIKKPERQFETYNCYNKATKEKCSTRVTVDNKPSNVTDFNCLSDNIEVLTCAWNSTAVISNVNYFLSFDVNGNPVKACKIENKGKLRYCVWNTTGPVRYKQFESQFLFNLTSCNFAGCIYQNFTIDHYAIVKPWPPTNLRVLANNTHSILLQWSVPINMDIISDGIDHKIEYQIAKIDNISYFRSVDTKGLEPNKRNYVFLLEDLPYAHTSYEVRIYIKPKRAVKDQFWSNSTFIMVQTASEEPQRPPEMVAGAFVQSVFDNTRMIYIYWKQLEEYDKGAENFTYKVVVRQGTKNPQTLHPDEKKSLSYVILDKASMDPLEVSVWSTNEIGSSINHSYLYIPSKKNTEYLIVSSFTNFADENGTYKLSWDGIDNLDNYTLFWCQYNASKVCNGYINFVVLDPKKTRHEIQLPRNFKYQFAISANKGYMSSGMVWAKCEISKDSLAIYGFPAQLSHGASGKTYVEITWSMSCNLEDGVIKGFIIEYCPVLDLKSNLCDNTFENNSLINITNPNQKATNATNLNPNKTYQFKLFLNTTFGIRSIENASTHVTTLEDTPTSPRNIHISKVEGNSLILSWDPPEPKNGFISKYIIYNYNEELQAESVLDDDTKRRYVNVTSLQGFTNYSLSVKACNTGIRACSEASPAGGIIVRTSFYAPSKLKAPSVQYQDNLLTWEPPEVQGGTVDVYQIEKTIGDQQPQIMNTTMLSFPVTYCEDGVLPEKYRVRAINYDEDPYHGAWSDNIQVKLPSNYQNIKQEYVGEWSDPSNVGCGGTNLQFIVFILVAVLLVVGAVYSSVKLYKKYRKMEDIKAVLPSGLVIPEKDINKYGFVWNTPKDEKPSSDEMLLLPSTKNTVSSLDTKQKDGDNCGSSNHTESSSVLSDSPKSEIERQISTSDDGTNSSLEVEPIENPSAGDGETQAPTSSFVQSVITPTSDCVDSIPVFSTQPSTSSYVMAGVSLPIFTTGVSLPSVKTKQNSPSGYVLREDAEPPTPDFSYWDSSPTELLGPESLPTMPTLPTPANNSVASSYIQLQSLDSLTSHKQPVCNVVPFRPTTSSGYVSRGDTLMNKQFNDMLSTGEIAEESVILDPSMSSDAYCRFSWSIDPANDNLHSLLSYLASKSPNN